MQIQQKRSWTTTALFSVILVSTAIFLEFGWSSVDPWAMPKAAQLKFEANEFPSLSGLEFKCTEQTGLLTKINFAQKAGECSKVLTLEVTRCAQMVPMRGFSDKIKCAKVEKKSCEQSGLQTLGLFEGDGNCGVANSETDLGPPALRAREDG